MKSAAKLFVLVLYTFLYESVAYVFPAVKQTFHGVRRTRQLLCASPSEMLETSTRPQDSSLALEQQGGLVMEAEKVLQGALVMEAEKVLGVSTASAIIGYLLFSHYDVASTQNIAHTLQHVLKAGGSQAWGSYQAFLSTNPIATKAATSATVYSIGDLIAQKTEGAEKLDAVRIARSGLAGGIGHGPLSHCWYNLSEEFFNNVIHLTAWWSFLPKIAVDQLVWGPIWNGCYILLLGLMKQESMDKMVGNVKSTTVPLFLDGLKLWPLAHCVTYGLLPVENRLLWVDLVEIFWVTILATKASSLAGDQDQSNTELLTAKR